MKIRIEFMGFLKFQDVRNDSDIEVPAGTSVDALLDSYNVDPSHKKYIVPVVNRTRTGLGHILSEGEHLFLYVPVGGG